MKRKVRYRCGCVMFFNENQIPSDRCETHGEPIEEHKIEKAPEVSPVQLNELIDNEVISAGDMIQFRNKDKLVQTEATLIIGKMTVNEFKKYSGEPVQVFRPTNMLTV
jgi:hypothetical protein